MTKECVVDDSSGSSFVIVPCQGQKNSDQVHLNIPYSHSFYAPSKLITKFVMPEVLVLLLLLLQVEHHVRVQKYVHVQGTYEWYAQRSLEIITSGHRWESSNRSQHCTNKKFTMSISIKTKRKHKWNKQSPVPEKVIEATILLKTTQEVMSHLT